NLPMQAPEKVGAHAQAPGLRVEHMQCHTRGGHRADELLGQVGGTIAIHGNVHTHATSGCLDRHLLQLRANCIFEEDEGLQHDAALSLAYRIEYGGKESFAVFEQFKGVPPGPCHCGHSVNSTASGAWSDR